MCGGDGGSSRSRSNSSSSRILFTPLLHLRLLSVAHRNGESFVIKKKNTNSQSTILPTPVATTEAYIAACAHNGYGRVRHSPILQSPFILYFYFAILFHFTFVCMVESSFRHVSRLWIAVDLVAHLCL